MLVMDAAYRPPRALTDGSTAVGAGDRRPGRIANRAGHASRTPGSCSCNADASRR